MAAKQHERSNSRRCALQVLYQSELLGVEPSSLIEDGKLIDETRMLDEYALNLLEEAPKCFAEVDPLIEEASQNWTMERMPIVDRMLLRLATYEMHYVEDVPVSVSINEAVNLAREFGGEDDSPRFVNGILGRIAETLQEEQHAE